MYCTVFSAARTFGVQDYFDEHLVIVSLCSITINSLLAKPFFALLTQEPHYSQCAAMLMLLACHYARLLTNLYCVMHHCTYLLFVSSEIAVALWPFFISMIVQNCTEMPSVQSWGIQLVERSRLDQSLLTN